MFHTQLAFPSNMHGCCLAVLLTAASGFPKNKKVVTFNKSSNEKCQGGILITNGHNKSLMLGFFSLSLSLYVLYITLPKLDCI